MASWLQFAALLAAACAVSGQRTTDQPTSSAWPTATEEPTNCHLECSCRGTSSMYCTNAQRTTPPEGYWSSLSYLALDGNKITKLSYYSLGGFPYITRLTLNNNQLTTLDPAPFSNLRSISSLELNGNHISSIGWEYYGKRFAELYLNDNKLTELNPLNVLSYWVANYGLVELKNNPLKAPPGKGFISTDYIYTLVLDGIDASEFSSDSFVGSTYYLATLSLQNAGVRNITGTFAKMRDLTTIWLSGNNITHVTAGSFYPGQTVLSLYLNDNPLQRVDVAAVGEAMRHSSGDAKYLVDISDTPLACECAYEPLYWWAEGRGVDLNADCKGDNACQFTR